VTESSGFKYKIWKLLERIVFEPLPPSGNVYVFKFEHIDASPSAFMDPIPWEIRRSPGEWVSIRSDRPIRNWIATTVRLACKLAKEEYKDSYESEPGLWALDSFLDAEACVRKMLGDTEPLSVLYLGNEVFMLCEENGRKCSITIRAKQP